MNRLRIVVAAALLATAAGCTGSASESLPARVSALPAGVSGLGPAVLLVGVAADDRDDLTGLVAVDRLGDDLTKVALVRRHVELALGDPTLPTVARGLARDPRDAVLSGGRVHDTTLPERTLVSRATGLPGPRAAATVAVTGPRCLVVRGDGQVRPPAAEATCEPGAYGGGVWQELGTSRYGGIDVATGRTTAAVGLPDPPFAASPDGRYLVAASQPPAAAHPRRLLVADTAHATSVTTSVAMPPTGAQPGVMTPAGYATVEVTGTRRLSVAGFDGTVRTLLSGVGDVTFAPDGTRALAMVPGGAGRRLAVVDLPGGTVRPVTGGAGPDGPVTAVVSAGHALVVQVTATVPGRPRPVRMWTVDLGAARLRPVPAPLTADRADVEPPASATAAATVRLSPGGDVVSLDAGGAAVTGPPTARPRLTLPHGRVLSVLSTGPERLLVSDAAGRRTQIRTGAAPDQVIGELVATPDGDHLIVALRSPGTSVRPGPRDEIVVTRLDGTGEPVVVYRGAILASLGLPA